jgi:hypothetical protein
MRVAVTSCVSGKRSGVRVGKMVAFVVVTDHCGELQLPMFGWSD